MIAWDFTAFIVPVLPGSWVKRVVGGAGDALGLSRLGRQAVRVASSGEEVGYTLLKFGDEGLPAIKKAGNEVVQETTEKGAKETGEEVFEETLKEQRMRLVKTTRKSSMNNESLTHRQMITMMNWLTMQLELTDTINI